MTPIDTSAAPELVVRARRNVARKMGFFIHAFVYIVVNAGLIAIDTLGGDGGRHWAQFPLLGWGLGLAIHGIVTFAAAPGAALHRRLMEREIESLRRDGR